MIIIQLDYNLNYFSFSVFGKNFGILFVVDAIFD